jgi:hypothetical protein
MTSSKDRPEEEGFLSRWSRLKHEGNRDAAKCDVSPDIGSHGHADHLPDADLEPRSPAHRPGAAAADETVPLADLPPLESIGPQTDLVPWLKKKLPAEWKAAALRRVWASDPAIADYVGLAEYAWDFNDQSAMPGFGPLDAVKDMAKLVAQAIGKSGHQSESDGDIVAVTQTFPSLQGANENPPPQAVDPHRQEKATPRAVMAEEDAGQAAEIPSEDRAQPDIFALPKRRGGALPV